MALNKDDFIKELSRRKKISLGEAAERVDSVLDLIITVTKTKGGVKFVGFGNFTKAKSAARVGRNPQTGEKLSIPENFKPKFKPGKMFIDAVAVKSAKTSPVANTEAPAARKPAARKPAAANA